MTIIRLSLLLAPFPLFIDGADLSIFLIYVEEWALEDLFNKKLSIPIPLCLICVAIIYQIWFLYSEKRSGVNLISKAAAGFGFIFLSLFSGIFYVLDVAATTILQMVMPIMLLTMMTAYDRLKVYEYRNAYTSGILMLLVMHLASVIYGNQFLLHNIERNFNYSSIFGVYIYQSLVSYSALMSLFVIFGLFLISEAKAYLLGFVIMVVAIILGAVSETRLFILDLIIVIGLTAIPNRVRFWHLQRRKLITLLPICILGIWGWTNYSNRLYSMGVSDRFELLSQAISEVFSDSSFLFWGHGLKHSYAHNFLLDFTLNYGILFLVIYLTLTAFTITNLYKNIQIEDNRARYLLMVLAIIGGNSFFNSAYTQPMFIINAVIVAQFIISPNINLVNLRSLKNRSTTANNGKVK